MIVSTFGSTPGAVLIEWSLKAASGSGMWDVHTRIGGLQGSQQQVAQCPTTAAVSADCEVASMSMQVTSMATGVYLENGWLWTADHDLESSTNTQIFVYTGRGLLIEGQNIWLYEMAVEHHSLYQYQFSGAKSITAGYIQTETPYYQPNPSAANSPYPTNSNLNDLSYSSCLGENCDALGLRVLNSNSVVIYGAGFIEGTTSGLVVYGLNTVGVTYMIVKAGAALAKVSDNLDTFAATIAYFTSEGILL
ncbi:CAZyme family GH55 [Penicillium odoratum]|uniref:CAZyme family GH55 n=1 Tax=Penicillium odoratum TaxID=1167516 RepID=UPI0025477EDE|nr:CAZyme family GH55 [Penicillium odoratum]KAJ5746821.1 CAZyme family GH55 [Penicillium odoratum]